jgi:AhpD family alkylhydroperoxidase
MPNEIELNQKEQSLIAVGASVAAGCQPCTAYHVKGARCQGATPDIDDEFRAQKVLIAELTSIATAVAVNSVPDLQKHLDAARDAGARVEQIRIAIEIARKIKRVAEEKVGAITDRIEKDAQATTTGGPGCCVSNEEEQPVVAADARTDCGCR